MAFVVVTVFALTLRNPGQDWAIAGVWAVYLSICTAGVMCVGMQFYCSAVCRGVPGKMRVALTFDDGPDPEATPRLLELLSREKIPAVFFCIGRNVDANPQLTARIGDEGHLLANHTYRHPWWISCLWGRRLTDEFKQAQQAIERAAGVTPQYARSPMGLTNPHFSKALRRTGLTLVAWDVRSFDTVGSVQSAVDRIIRKTRDGSIILMHDGGVSPQRVVEIVSASITELRCRGFEFDRLDHLIASGRS
jgi:peptidoglycan-N-acetylglucosamine deacetylase